ncbi:MAG: HPF/RaiA family ribosome-associated protein [Paludibacteraceae bacterium]|nr:HPF/RaiA family ribosome-associated protein [Paludibacteraceae bacterium]
MKVNVNAVNFEMHKQLEDYIEKKTSRFARHLKENDEVEIRLTVIKPAAQMNKEVQVKIGDMFVEKKSDSFEDGINECIEALDKQIERRKER